MTYALYAVGDRTRNVFMKLHLALVMLMSVAGFLCAANAPTLDAAHRQAIQQGILNNLKTFASQSQQYMLYHETANGTVSYKDLVKAKVITADQFKPVDGEDYSTLVMTPVTTSIQITSASGITVKYDMR